MVAISCSLTAAQHHQWRSLGCNTNRFAAVVISVLNLLWSWRPLLYGWLGCWRHFNRVQWALERSTERMSSIIICGTLYRGCCNVLLPIQFASLMLAPPAAAPQPGADWWPIDEPYG
jgi:hypothetical protein